MIPLEGMSPCCCGCGRQEFLHVLHLTGGLAWECFRDDVLGRLDGVRIYDQGAIITLRKSKRRTKVTKPRGQRGSDETRRASHAARQAAQKRLVQLYHDTYDVLYNDERVKRGLPVIPLRVPYGAFADAVAVKAGTMVYSAGSTRESP